jgi:hypothetical protein
MSKYWTVLIVHSAYLRKYIHGIKNSQLIIDKYNSLIACIVMSSFPHLFFLLASSWESSYVLKLQSCNSIRYVTFNYCICIRAVCNKFIVVSILGYEFVFPVDSTAPTCLQCLLRLICNSFSIVNKVANTTANHIWHAG